jgi:hypothetical protein
MVDVVVTAEYCCLEDAKIRLVILSPETYHQDLCHKQKATEQHIDQNQHPYYVISTSERKFTMQDNATLCYKIHILSSSPHSRIPFLLHLTCKLVASLHYLLV